MVLIRFGRGVDGPRERRVACRTVGEALDALAADHAWVGDRSVRWFVNGIEFGELEGRDTPVGEEDTLLATRW